MLYKCLHSFTTSLCRICTNPPVLHDRACLTDILAPHPSQAVGISNGEWLYRRRMLSLHSSADRRVPFNQFWEDQKPCTSGKVLRIPSRHGGFVPAAAVEEDLLILEPIPSS